MLVHFHVLLSSSYMVLAKTVLVGWDIENTTRQENCYGYSWMSRAKSLARIESNIELSFSACIYPRYRPEVPTYLPKVETVHVSVRYITKFLTQPRQVVVSYARDSLTLALILRTFAKLDSPIQYSSSSSNIDGIIKTVRHDVSRFGREE
jgi:hypothetical protein